MTTSFIEKLELPKFLKFCDDIIDLYCDVITFTIQDEGLE